MILDTHGVLVGGATSVYAVHLYIIYIFIIYIMYLNYVDLCIFMITYIHIEVSSKIL